MSRLYLTQREWDELFELHGRKCCVEGCEEGENLQAEHSTPEVWRHGKPVNPMIFLKVRSDRELTAKADAPAATGR